MALATEVFLGPGDIVLDGDPTPKKGEAAPTFRPIHGLSNGTDASDLEGHFRRLKLF